MGSLRDELFKAGLISKKQARQSIHEERVERKKLGAEGIQEREEEKDKEWKQQKEQKKQQDRKLEEEKKIKRENQEKVHRIRDLVRSNTLKEGMYGNRKFYFVIRDGRIPFVSISEEASRKLENGGMAIVEMIGIECVDGDIVFVDRATAEKIKGLDPEYIRFCN